MFIILGKMAVFIYDRILSMLNGRMWHGKMPILLKHVAIDEMYGFRLKTTRHSAPSEKLSNGNIKLEHENIAPYALSVAVTVAYEWHFPNITGLQCTSNVIRYTVFVNCRTHAKKSEYVCVYVTSLTRTSQIFI